jgi:hypothetical protein
LASHDDDIGAPTDEVGASINDTTTMMTGHAKRATRWFKAYPSLIGYPGVPGVFRGARTPVLLAETVNLGRRSKEYSAAWRKSVEFPRQAYF